MFYSGVALSMLLGASQAFIIPTSPQRMTLKMVDEPWNAGSVGSNMIDMSTLK